jgi:hypothetical protein
LTSGTYSFSVKLIFCLALLMYLCVVIYALCCIICWTWSGVRRSAFRLANIRRRSWNP